MASLEPEQPKANVNFATRSSFFVWKARVADARPAVLPDGATLIRPTTRGAPSHRRWPAPPAAEKRRLLPPVYPDTAKTNTDTISPPITRLNFCKSASGNASSGYPSRIASTTASPTICASRNGTRLGVSVQSASSGGVGYYPVAPRPTWAFLPEYRPAPNAAICRQSASCIERIEQPLSSRISCYTPAADLLRSSSCRLAPLVRDRTYRNQLQRASGFSAHNDEPEVTRPAPTKTRFTRIKEKSKRSSAKRGW